MAVLSGHELALPPVFDFLDAARTYPPLFGPLGISVRSGSCARWRAQAVHQQVE
jgi:hypothetical protein